MRFRSPRELAFRARQLLLGIADYLLPPPRYSKVMKPLAMPDVPCPEDVRDLAERILRHEFPVFGEAIETGPEIYWRRDYRHGIDTRIEWFRRIPYLDFKKCGDHKYIWELNRHQHLVMLAQAWNLFGDSRYLAEIDTQIESWDAQNPYLRSINWASSLELAFRSISWLWVLHLTRGALPSQRISELLYQHGVAISHNLSTYFAPNTHLLGEGVALHAIGLGLGVERWTRLGKQIVAEQMRSQVQQDGFHFEQSSYYHLYALDMFRFQYFLEGQSSASQPILDKMADVFDALLDERGAFPLIGDDDGGRWLFSSPIRQVTGDRCEHFASCGLTVFRRGPVHLTFDCGPFARGGAGHSHADTLSITLRIGGIDVLVDPGTYTYVADEQLRNWFRGTGAHCTLRFNGVDQGVPAGPFRWATKPLVRRLDTGEWTATGECLYRGWSHRRRIDLTDVGRLIVEDSVAGDIKIEQIWHSQLPITPRDNHIFAIGSYSVQLDTRLEAEIQDSWCSPVYGSREKSYLLVGRVSAPFAEPLVTTFLL